MSELDLALRDPELPELALLLDDTALSAWLDSAVGASAVRRKYLRYKPGTAMVVTVSAGNEELVVWHWAEPGRPKLEKLCRKAPEGSILYVDHAHRLVLSMPAADRHLPGLRALESGWLPDWVVLKPGPVTLKALSYKPRRRWVGSVACAGEPMALLRVYPPPELPRFVAAARTLAGTGAPVPVLRGVDEALGVAGFEWVPGAPLSLPASVGEYRALGEALAELHGSGTGVGGLSVGQRIEDLRETLRLASWLMPSLAGRLDAVGRVSVRSLAGRKGSATLHGDLSADQIVLGPDGSLNLIDLDRVRTGDPAEDFGCLGASGLLQGLSGFEVLDEVVAGYGSAVDPWAVQAWTLYHLLVRSTDAFRACEPDWPQRLTRAVELAEEMGQGL
ncbi:hypothetical protein Kisp01_39900 [Kineosporia sp. NBRC 101677]|uniref:phosphotransferase n=1 Tax=Kineosporia sp. NBRC 101677 TaxID=3032197 RepID=UPI0024A16C27|nr:phosphotransferase [Kineosporia sp. NBRC 101677]GLY16975.1 hypothetical protein Kisp01_39900 [Kineosporia sp. NBRC 101677]